jgi:hypothetical protein
LTPTPAPGPNSGTTVCEAISLVYNLSDLDLLHSTDLYLCSSCTLSLAKAFGPHKELRDLAIENQSFLAPYLTPVKADPENENDRNCAFSEDTDPRSLLEVQFGTKDEEQDKDEVKAKDPDALAPSRAEEDQDWSAAESESGSDSGSDYLGTYLLPTTIST